MDLMWCQRSPNIHFLLLQTIDDVGSGGAGVGGSAATGNVNGNYNTGAVGGDGTGGTGVNNGRRLRQQVPMLSLSHPTTNLSS